MKKLIILTMVTMLISVNITIVSAQEVRKETGVITENEALPDIEITSIKEIANEVVIEGVGVSTSETDQLKLFVNDVLVDDEIQKDPISETPTKFKNSKNLNQNQLFKFNVTISSNEFINGDNQVSATLNSNGLVLCKTEQVRTVVKEEAGSASTSENKEQEAIAASLSLEEEATPVVAYSAPVSPAAIMYLDSFNYNEDTSEIAFKGWSMSNTKGTWLEILIDGALVKTQFSRTARNDVYSSVKGFGGAQENPLPGFEGTTSVKQYGSGTHSVIIRTVDAYKVLNQKVTSFTVPGEKSATFIDRAVVADDRLTISGWSMSSHKNDGVWVQVLIDDALVTNSTSRSKRDDVVSSVKGYGSAKMNPTPGYSTSLDVSMLNAGQHKVTVRTVTAYAVLDSVSTTISIAPERTRTFIDSATVSSDTLKVTGWSMSSHKKNGVWVQVLIDDVLATNSTTRSKRDDVYVGIKDCGSPQLNKTPGYTANVDIKNLESGQHKVTVRTVTAYAVLDSSTTYFNYKNTDSGNSNKPIVNVGYKMNIESSKVEDGKLLINGWSLTSKQGSWLQVLVDGVLMTNDTSRFARDDVLNVYGNFDKIVNAKAGYSANINVGNLLNGNHTVTVRIVDAYSVYDSISTTFRTTNSAGSVTSPLFGIDVSEHNGSIDWKTTSKNIDFAMLRAGWGYYTDDKKFDENIKGAQENGVPVGIYFYTYALNMDEAKKEVDGLIASLSNYSIKYPVFIDMEDADGYKSKNGMPSNAMLQEICIYFCERLTAAGYTAGVYANLDWWRNRLENPKLDNYIKWVAQWNSSCSYTKPYHMWQYTSDGSVPGISGRVDLNYSYYAF